MVLPVLACLPGCVGEAPWQDAQLKSLAAVALKNFCPRRRSAFWPAACWYCVKSASGEVSPAKLAPIINDEISPAKMPRKEMKVLFEVMTWCWPRHLKQFLRGLQNRERLASTFTDKKAAFRSRLGLYKAIMKTCSQFSWKMKISVSIARRMVWNPSARFGWLSATETFCDEVCSTPPAPEMLKRWLYWMMFASLRVCCAHI